MTYPPSMIRCGSMPFRRTEGERFVASLATVALGSSILVASIAGQAKVVSAADLTDAQQTWVGTTLASMTLEEKAAQMMMVAETGWPRNPRSHDTVELVEAVRDRGVGGVILMRSEEGSIAPLLNRLQTEARIPLLVAMDMERSLSFRVQRGSVDLPYAMAFGATGDEAAARFLGEVTAREGRALGIHWAFAPVVDVNNNPDNPIINIRSFGEDPELVGRLGAAFIRGAHSGGLMTTAKHFPGHGDTSVDSHLDLPVIAVDREHLETVEWPPFRAAIAAGVDSIMVGHVAVPALDPSGRPATLSPSLNLEILRGEMGFEGLIVTDAMDMEGVGSVWIGAATVDAVRAGADVILMPPDLNVALQSLVRAVAEGELEEQRLDQSVRRILEAKARLHLDENRLVDLNTAALEVDRPEDVEKALEIAEASITVVRNDDGVLPLAAEQPLRILQIVMPDDLGIPAAEFRTRRIDVTTIAVGDEISQERADEILDEVDGFSHILVSTAYYREKISDSLVRFLGRLAATDVPVIVISLGDPYLFRDLPEVSAYVCAYGASGTSRQAAAAALFGEFDVRGRLPVTLSEEFAVGWGLEIPRRAMTLRVASAEDVGFRPGGLDDVDLVAQEFVEDGAFPGGVVAVGYRGNLVYLHPFGHLTYDEGAPAVEADTMYDLASLTKVVATTTMAMILVDEGRLDLDASVQDYLPLFQGPGKESVTIRQLLTHSSGVNWWAPLYEEAWGPDAYLERIQAMELVYEPGTDFMYSDLGIILLGEILSRVAGQPLQEFVQERVFEPLGMTDTLYAPGPDLLPRIAPTEYDTWRGCLVRGEVHDENAFALGGVAPHAGLFSTAGDLARFTQMLLNGGVLEHHRIVSRETVELFTSPAGNGDSTRALGWDTKSPEKSSAGMFFSPRSFGHTGFTGTSIWVDPDRELFVILLTNRVYPTRDNQLIRKARPAVADAVVTALVDDGIVRVGLDRVAAGENFGLRGKRLGLVAHAASVTFDGRHAIDVLRDKGFDVVRIFTPEHGLQSRAAAGETVDSGTDPESGLPVVSLYGDHRKPTVEDLEGLDALVFDLQGGGVRFYTYVSTLMLALEAAAEAGVEFVVLDRPNPLGGERIEGPLSAPRVLVPSSFVNMAPGPLVHGLTLGEMARFVNQGLAEPARLTVVPMKGWERWMTWVDTGRPWVPPSPNIRSAEAAIAYPGVCLLEASNVSVGRGTASPFLSFGAPWFRPSEMQVSVPGFELEPASFTPVTSPAAPDAKYLDQECRGMRVRVTDAATAQSYRLGVELLAALQGFEGFEWSQDGAALTRLVGSPNLLDELRRGMTAAQIVEADAPAHEAWRRDRAPFLLY
jgi:beta-N-acetylhexosaminidase